MNSNTMTVQILELRKKILIAKKITFYENEVKYIWFYFLKKVYLGMEKSPQVITLNF